MSEQIPQITPPVPLSAAEEKQWAMIAHLSVLINLFTVFMGTFIPLLIYLIYKDRSRFVAYHALQSFIMQAICSFGGSVFAIVIGGIGGMIPGIKFNMPAYFLFICNSPGGRFNIYCTYGGIQVNNGQDFKYWMIGDWVRSTLTG